MDGSRCEGVEDDGVGAGVEGREHVFGLALHDGDVGEGLAVDEGILDSGGDSSMVIIRR